MSGGGSNPARRTPHSESVGYCQPVENLVRNPELLNSDEYSGALLNRLKNEGADAEIGDQGSSRGR